MATTTIAAREALTNGVSFGISHTVVATNLGAANDSITFDFGVTYYLVPQIMIVSSTGAIRDLSTMLIDASVAGKITITEVSGTFALAENDVIYLIVQRKGL